MRNYSNQNYTNHWIGRQGTFLDWPPCFPDLVPNDFFLWGHLKSVLYKTPLNTIEDLKQRITECCKKISSATFHSVRQEFLHQNFISAKN